MASTFLRRCCRGIALFGVVTAWGYELTGQFPFFPTSVFLAVNTFLSASLFGGLGTVTLTRSTTVMQYLSWSRNSQLSFESLSDDRPAGVSDPSGTGSGGSDGTHSRCLAEATVTTGMTGRSRWLDIQTALVSAFNYGGSWIKCKTIDYDILVWNSHDGTR